MRNAYHRNQRRKLCVDEQGKTRISFLTVQQACAAMANLWDPLESTCRHASLSIL